MFQRDIPQEFTIPGVAAAGLVGVGAHRRLKMDSGATGAVAPTFSLCGSTDVAIGNGATPVNATGELFTVNLDGPVKLFVASKAIAAAVPVYAAANGKISDSGTVLIGVSAEAAGADGDVIGVFVNQQSGTISWPTIETMTPITANGAIDTTDREIYVITKAGVAAMTLAAPVAGTGDGIVIEITSATAYAHTITATGGLFMSGTNLVTTVTFPAVAGVTLRLVSYNGYWMVLSGNQTNLPKAPVVITGDSTPNTHISATYILTKGSAAAITLGAPTTGIDDGVEITFISGSDYAHVITGTDLVMCGATANDTITFAAKAGASVTLVAYAAKWYTKAQIQATFG